MPSEFKVPELGENIESGVVVKLLVSAGDTLAMDQPIMELETGKATLEVPSTVSGTIKSIQVKEGDEVKVGQVILTVDGEGAKESEPEASADKAPKAAEPPDAEPAESETVKPAKPEAEKQPSSKKPAPARETVVEKPAAETAPIVTTTASVPAAPSVRRFARELGVDVAQVSGTGPGGRISVEDVKAHVKKVMTSPAPATGAAGPAVPSLPDFAKWGGVRREAMSAIRRRTAEHLSLSWTTIPHVTQFDTADITALEETRKELNKQSGDENAKITVTVILAKIAAAAMKTFPKFNSSADMQKREIIFKDYYNIGFAVDTDRGLLVPVIRDIDKKNMVQVAAELTQLAAKAREGKVHPDDLSGGNFTITNLGGIGGTHFTPIINWPEVAILGVGRAYEQLDPREPSRIRLTLPLSLSYDHRVIDGAEGIRFLRWVVETLENPMRLVLQG